MEQVLLKFRHVKAMLRKMILLKTTAMAHFDGESGHRVVSKKLPFHNVGMD